MSVPRWLVGTGTFATCYWDFGHDSTQSYDILTSKSHNYVSYMQNHMCGNPNNNFPNTSGNVTVRHTHLKKKGP